MVAWSIGSMRLSSMTRSPDIAFTDGSRGFSGYRHAKTKRDLRRALLMIGTPIPNPFPCRLGEGACGGITGVGSLRW